MSPVFAEIIGWEFLLVIGIVALLFGSSQIPKFARSIGEASKELKKGMAEGQQEDSSESTPKATATDAPKVEAPKVEAPKVEAPKVEAPENEAATTDSAASDSDTPQQT